MGNDERLENQEVRSFCGAREWMAGGLLLRMFSASVQEFATVFRLPTP